MEILIKKLLNIYDVSNRFFFNYQTIHSLIIIGENLAKFLPIYTLIK